MRRLINNGDDVVEEWTQGYTQAYKNYVTLDKDNPRVILSKKMGTNPRVRIVIGGGSGHEPLFPGYVGKNLADASVVGNVNTSPSPQAALEAVKKVDAGKGVLFIYGNYSGDVMNFDMASDMVKDEGNKIETVTVKDDVYSSKNFNDRRGVAGDLYAIKVACAAAAKGLDLQSVKKVTEKATKHTFSMGMSLSSESNPVTGKNVFDMKEGDMEIGMGIHGEPGIKREKLKPANKVVDELLTFILKNGDFKKGDTVRVLLDGLGGLPFMDQFICYRRVNQVLKDKNIKIDKSLVGDFVTSMDMIGMSITLFRLDGELKKLLDFPCDSPYLKIS